MNCIKTFKIFASFKRVMFGDCKKHHCANRHTLKYNIYFNFGFEAFKLVYSSSIKKKRNHILRGILRVHID